MVYLQNKYWVDRHSRFLGFDGQPTNAYMVNSRLAQEPIPKNEGGWCLRTNASVSFWRPYVNALIYVCNYMHIT